MQPLPPSTKMEISPDKVKEMKKVAIIIIIGIVIILLFREVL